MPHRYRHTKPKSEQSNVFSFDSPSKFYNSDIVSFVSSSPPKFKHLSVVNFDSHSKFYHSNIVSFVSSSPPKFKHLSAVSFDSPSKFYHLNIVSFVSSSPPPSPTPNEHADRDDHTERTSSGGNLTYRAAFPTRSEHRFQAPSQAVSGTLKEGCRKPVLGVCLPSAPPPPPPPPGLKVFHRVC